MGEALWNEHLGERGRDVYKRQTYVIPPFMMHGSVVQGVMSFPEMDAMMYKIEGEDLSLIHI